MDDIPFYSNSETDGIDKADIVTISHDHYDHLNIRTLKKLPKQTYVYVPLGTGNEIHSGFQNTTAMDWYTVDRIEGLKIHFLPANHSSGRSLNINASLWSGWLFEYDNFRVYFSGDSGYSDLFKDIGNRFGKIDICLMPISSYFQRDAHFAPEDAIQAALDCGCKTLIPWGWGTYIMGFEHILEPIRRFQYAWKEIQPQNMELHMLNMGETYSSDYENHTAGN